MSTIVQKETHLEALYTQTFYEQQEFTEIISFLEQIRSFQIPSSSVAKSSSISFSKLRFENNSQL